MGRIEIGDSDNVKGLHFMGRFDIERFPTHTDQESAIGRAIRSIESRFGPVTDEKIKVSLGKKDASYVVSLVLSDSKVPQAKEIGEHLHRELKELWPPDLS